MRKCRFCHGDIDDAARVCVHCGRDLFGGHTIVATDAPPLALTPPAAAPTPVAIAADHDVARQASAIGLNILEAFLVLLALSSAGCGLLSLSNATQGVGLLTGGCFLLILARLIQADVQHRALRHTIATRSIR
jgi:hypothetical protein